MKTISKLFLSLLLILGTLSCNIESDDSVLDPNGIQEVTAESLLPGIQAQIALNEGGTAPRLAGTVIQQLEYTPGCGFTQSGQWNSRLALNNFWRTALYSGTLINSQKMIDLAGQEGKPFYAGLGKILLAHQYGIATAYFGDIPFSEALQGEDNLFPKYDSQEDVYIGVLKLLDEGINEISGGGYVSGDLIYDGDVSLWIKTANALKARYYMHQYKRNSAYLDMSLEAINQSYDSDSETAYFQFEDNESANYSFAAFGIERPSTLVLHENFLTILEDDPRLVKYAYEKPDQIGFYDISGSEELVWGRNNAKVPLISYCEIKFLEAEILTRQGLDGSAGLGKAIAANMNMNEVDAILANNYMFEKIELLESLNESERLNLIMLEAHKAYFGFNFHESWTNYRRTGFPEMDLDHVLVTEHNPSAVIPRRALYVAGEMEFNAENVIEAEARQGGAELDDLLWAFQ